MPLQALHDLPAPAKLNLFLHVNGRRADGYHLLQSVFVLIDWADTIHLEARADGQLRRHDLGPALPADDLSLRAARALQQASGCTLGADISVQKNVPWGAGMGGGSSDAATVLLALNRLWGLHLPRARLLEFGSGEPSIPAGQTPGTPFGSQSANVRVPRPDEIPIRPDARPLVLRGGQSGTRDTGRYALHGHGGCASGRHRFEDGPRDLERAGGRSAGWLLDDHGSIGDQR